MKYNKNIIEPKKLFARNHHEFMMISKFLNSPINTYKLKVISVITIYIEKL